MKKIIEYQSDEELVAKMQLIIKEKAKKLASPYDAYKMFESHARDEKESFLLAVLDGAHNHIKTIVVTVGLVNRTIVHPREVLRPAIQLNGAAIIVCHNHPSGNMEPSPEDSELTVRLQEAASIIGIPLLDHLIISKNGYISMVETGQMVMRS